MGGAEALGPGRKNLDGSTLNPKLLNPNPSNKTPPPLSLESPKTFPAVVKMLREAFEMVQCCVTPNAAVVGKTDTGQIS